MPIASKLSSPVLRAWLILIIFWPLSDALRKWSGLNQPAYVLQLLVPFFIGYFLWRRNALVLDRSIAAPALLLSISTGLTAFFYAITEYSLAYLGVWFLSLSALIGPILLLCTRGNEANSKLSSIRKNANLFVVTTSILFFANNILSIMQSVLGRSHILSAVAGGGLDAQIKTNTAIELRAPGFFTFVLGSANYSTICIIFLLSSFLVVLPLYTSIIRTFALLSLPVALARSISRTFLFIILTVCLPWIQLVFRYRVLIGIIFLGLTFYIIGIFYPYLIDILNDGLTNFDQRIEEADGFTDGILLRFFSSFYLHMGGGTNSLFFNLFPWYQSDPLPMLFGYGLGFSGPLFRFTQGIQSTAYGLVSIEGNQFILGETFYPSLLADIGIVNFAVYLWLLVNSLRIFLRSFPVFPFTYSRAYVHASLVAFLLALFNPTTPYFRPLTVLFFTAAVLNPYVCKLLFEPLNDESA